MRSLWIVAVLMYGVVAQPTHADVDALLDLRAVRGDDTQDWLHQGLGKQRFDAEHDGVKLGQGIIEIKSMLTETLSSRIVANAYDDRKNTVDVTEAYLQWKPLPMDGYRFKTKIGAFFPTLSLENNGIGWTNPWMLSTSAINTWVGEELRTIGSEFSFSRPGQLNNSPHDFEMIAAVFIANDPAGGLLSWRGWSVGDRITGLTERLPLPEISSITSNGTLANSQVDWEEPFHEIDKRKGYYGGINYGYNGWLTLRALHYDNQGNPFGLQNLQWSWTTRFNHLALRLDLPNDFTLMSQYMKGSTRWGFFYYGADIDFASEYLLLSKSFGKQRISARYDNFSTTDKDITYQDNNAEHGHAIALTWLMNLNEKNQYGVEYLKILSARPGREYLNYAYNPTIEATTVAETSVQVFYRFKF